MKNRTKYKQPLYLRIVLLLQLVLCTTTSASPTAQTITYLNPEDDDHYFVKVLKLSLDKTKDQYGEYTLRFHPKMNRDQALAKLRENSTPNAIRMLMPKKHVLSMENIRHIPFPLQRGILGYRICSYSDTLHRRVANISRLAELKSFSFLQGVGWPDGDILSHHGFDVNIVDLSTLEGNPIRGMYEMAANGQVDFFCRGAHELKAESGLRRQVPSLKTEQTMALYYPAPLFFYVGKSNTTLANRVLDGLQMAYKDGAFLSLWKEHYDERLVFSNLEKRKIYRLDSPLTLKIDQAYRDYVYRP